MSPMLSHGFIVKVKPNVRLVVIFEEVTFKRSFPSWSLILAEVANECYVTIQYQ